MLGVVSWAMLVGYSEADEDTRRQDCQRTQLKDSDRIIRKTD